MRLRDLAVAARPHYEREREFNRRTHCVVDHYLLHLPKVDSGDYSKVYVQLWPEVPDEKGVRLLLDVIEVNVQFNFKDYWMATIPQQRRMILDVLEASIEERALQLGWPIDIFRNVYEELLLEGMEFKHYVTPWKSSPNRRRKASVWLEHDEKAAHLYLIIQNSEEEKITRIHLSDVEPHRMFVAREVNIVKWRGNDTVEIHGRSGAVRTVDVSEIVK